jgi:hypothetical protein
VAHGESLEQREGGSGFVPRAIPEEPPLALWAAEFRVDTDKSALRIKYFAYDASTEFNLASPALFHELAARKSVDDRDEFASVACWTFASFAKSHA